MLARSWFDQARVAEVLVAVSVGAAVAGGLVARFGRRNRGLATTCLLVAGALGVLASWTAADAYAWSVQARLAGLAVALAATLFLLGVFSPVGRGGVVGAGAVVGAAVVWDATALLQSDPALHNDPARVGAVLAVVSVTVLGVLPRFALTAAGLAGLDDRRCAGVSVSRQEVVTALAATHRGLVLATVVTAASATAAGWLAVSTPNPWTVGLTVVLAVVLLSRARAYPLVAEVVALLAAGAVLLVRLVVLWERHRGGPPYGPLAVVAGAALLPLGVLAVHPPEHVRVRLRRIADVGESAGVIALFPLAVGVFGVYARLLGAF
jgi:hypothetical protein